MPRVAASPPPSITLHGHRRGQLPSHAKLAVQTKRLVSVLATLRSRRPNRRGSCWGIRAMPTPQPSLGPADLAQNQVCRLRLGALQGLTAGLVLRLWTCSETSVWTPNLRGVSPIRQNRYSVGMLKVPYVAIATRASSREFRDPHGRVPGPPPTSRPSALGRLVNGSETHTA